MLKACQNRWETGDGRLEWAGGGDGVVSGYVAVNIRFAVSGRVK